MGTCYESLHPHVTIASQVIDMKHARPLLVLSAVILALAAVVVHTAIAAMAATETRPAKRARMLSLQHRLPYMSQSALAAVVQEAAREPLPDHCTRSEIRLGRDEVCSQDTPYGKLHQKIELMTTTGAAAHVEYCAPIPMLYVAARTSEPFRALILRTMAQFPPTPSTPWNLIGYTDEIVPGNALSYENIHKVQALYYSFKEFGYSLCDEESWFTSVVVASRTVKNLAGGMSAIFGAFLKLFFCMNGHDARTAGISIDLGDGNRVRLFVKFCCQVSDEPALKDVWKCIGSSGIKICMLCQNVVDSRLDKEDTIPLTAHDRSGLLIHHTEHDCRKFVAHTKGTIVATLADLERRRDGLSNTAYKELQKCHGWGDPTHSLLRDAQLFNIVDPTTQVCFDWAHTFFIHGIFNIMFGHMMIHMKDINITYDTIYGYMLLWHWPVRLGEGRRTAAEVFNPKRAKSSWKAKVLNATMSEGLSTYAIIKHFLHVANVSTRLPLICAAYFAMCSVIDMLLVVVRPGVVTAEALYDAITRMLITFKDAFGDATMVSKFHAARHLDQFLARFGTLFSTITHERKHKVAKRFMNDFRNSKGFDESITRNCTCHHLEHLKAPGRFGSAAGLEPPVQAVKGRLLTYLQNEFGNVAFQMSTSARFSAYGRVSRGDVVAMSDGTHGHELVVASVQRLVDVIGEALALCDRYTLMSNHGDYGVWSRQHAQPYACHVTDIVEVLLWTATTDTVTVLYPYSLRQSDLIR